MPAIVTRAPRHPRGVAMKIDRRGFVKVSALGAGGAAAGLSTSACGSPDYYAIKGAGPFLAVNFRGLSAFIFKRGSASSAQPSVRSDAAQSVKVVLMNPDLVSNSSHIPRLTVDQGSATTKRINLANAKVTFEITPRN